MPIYTGTGDAGDTGLFDNRRVPKDDLRIEVYGTVDELNSFVGLLRSEELPAGLDSKLEHIQNVLFELGSDLATPGSTKAVPLIEKAITAVEGWIDESEGELLRLSTFVLPGGHREASLLHVLRTVTRRAERLFWALHRRDPLPLPPGVYLNRLSDLFFSLARGANQRHGIADVPWRRNG